MVEHIVSTITTRVPYLLTPTTVAGVKRLAVFDFVRLSVCVFVRTIKLKRLKLKIIKLVTEIVHNKFSPIN